MIAINQSYAWEKYDNMINLKISQFNYDNLFYSSFCGKKLKLSFYVSCEGLPFILIKLGARISHNSC